MDERMYPSSGGGVKSRYVDGVLNFYDSSGNLLYGIDPANRKVVYATGTTVELQTGAIMQVNASNLDVTELAYLDGLTLGVIAASKAVTASANSSIRLGAFATGGATTGALALIAGMDAYSDGQVDVLSIFGASTTNLTSAKSAKLARFRHLVNCTTAAHETYAAMGQIVAKDTTLTHLHAGVIGTFEGHTSGVVLNSSYTVGHAAVMARIGGHAAITLTTPLAGFLAFNNQSAGVGAGAAGTAAFATSAFSATYPWSVGLLVPTGSVSKLFEAIIASVPTTKFGSSLYVTQTSGQSEGLCAYFDGTVAGTPAGHTYNVGSWINLASGAIPGASCIMTPIETGVYDGGATLTNARIVFGGTHQAIFNNGAPGSSLHCWRLNSTVALTALIQAGNAASVGYVAGTGTGVACGYITFFTSPDGPGTGYIKVYSATSGG